MKKIFFFALLAVVSFAPHAFAEGFTALAPIPGLTDISPTSVINSDTLSTFFNNLYKYLIGIAAILAVLQIIWAGLDIAFFHKDAVATIVDDKGKIYNAIFGLVLVLAPFLVFSIINPSILNLSLDLPKLYTATNIQTNSPGANSGPNAGQQWCYFRSIVAGEGDTICSPTEQACNAGRTTDQGTYDVTPCSQSQTAASTGGCTTVHTGPYMEKATCVNSNNASAYTCKNGLTLSVSACTSIDAGTGRCLVPYTVYCSGKTAVLTAYSYYQSYTGILIGNTTFVPRDRAAADSFANGCRADGGVYLAERTAGASAFIASHAWQASTATNGCAADSGVVIDTSKGGGVLCFSNQLSCNPPN